MSCNNLFTFSLRMVNISLVYKNCILSFGIRLKCPTLEYNKQMTTTTKIISEKLTKNGFAFIFFFCLSPNSNEALLFSNCFIDKIVTRPTHCNLLFETHSKQNKVNEVPSSPSNVLCRSKNICSV